MNKYLKAFLHRGAIFGGFGPVVTGIVYLILSFYIDVTVSSTELFFVITSTYLLAFIHAGCSILPQIEHWSISKVMLIHFSALYASYTLCYFLNSWLPFNFKILLIYTCAFVIVFLAIWVTVLYFAKRAERKMNSELNK